MSQRESAAAQPTAHGLASFYNAIYRDRDIQLPPHLAPVCMGLADKRIRKMMLIIGPGSGKSMLLSQAFPAWMLGIDPTMTIIGVSAGEALVHGFIHSVMNLIEWSAAYHAIFPSVRPDKVQGWSTERGIFVTGRRPGDPDASYWGGGLNSAALTGKHARMLIFDDLQDKDNSATVDQCMKVREAYYNTLMGRADPQGCRMILAGRRWHEEDIYGHLKQSEDWVVLELPAERAESKELYYDVTVPDGMECCFTEMARAA
jgi:hypothetical protein